MDDDTTSERWLPVRGYGDSYADRYEVSDSGRVRCTGFWVRRGYGSQAWWGPRPINGTRSKHEPHHVLVTLSDGERRTGRRLHHLVLYTFVGPKPFPEAQGLHFDDDVLNNSPSNLYWGSAQDNAYDRIRNGKNSHYKTTHCPRGHALVAPNLSSRASQKGHRQCQACSLTTMSRRYDADRKSRRRQWRMPCGFWRDLDESFQQEADRRYEFIMQSEGISRSGRPSSHG